MRNIAANIRFRALVAALLLALGFTAGPATGWAKPGDSYRQEQRQTISKSRAAALVKQRFGGKVLKVQRQKSGKGLIYRVKLLQDSGHVRQVSVDAQTGAILGG